MSDSYPRVRTEPNSLGDAWERRSDGVHKVVPFDAIVTERSVVPKVRRSAAAPDYVFIEGSDGETWIGSGVDVDDIRATALRNLALAEHLEAHPPVDEELLLAIRTVIRDHDEQRGVYPTTQGDITAYEDRLHEIARLIASVTQTKEPRP